VLDRILHTLHRFGRAEPSASSRASVRRDLAQARRLLLRGQVEAAWVPLERAHDRSRNAPWLHTRAHAWRVLGWAERRRPGALVRELPLVLMASPAALVRRAAGLHPSHPGGRGLWATWQLRGQAR